MVLGGSAKRRNIALGVTFLTLSAAVYLLFVGPWLGADITTWRFGQKTFEVSADGNHPSSSPSDAPHTPSKSATDETATPDTQRTSTDGPAGNASTKRVLLVSALYPLAKSKHSHKDYEVWLQRFLGKITTDIYFYAPPSLENLVLRTYSQATLNQNFPSNSTGETKSADSQKFKLNTAYETAFSIPPLHGLEEVYAGLHQKDRERKKHSPELYAVWNAKPFFLNKAVEEMQERAGNAYDYAFWVDAGSFREEHTFRRWPDVERVEEIFRQGGGRRGDGEDAIFFPIFDPPGYRFRTWQEDMGPVDDEVSEGSFFGGTPKAIHWYNSAFYAYHDHYLSLGHFVGKDQTLINALFLLFPRRFITMWRRDPSIRTKLWPSGKCGSPWYYYEFVMANEEEREGMERIWADKLHQFWKLVKGWVPGGKQGCPLTEALSMEVILKRTFGERWKGVEANVELHLRR